MHPWQLPTVHGGKDESDGDMTAKEDLLYTSQSGVNGKAMFRLGSGVVTMTNAKGRQWSVRVDQIRAIHLNRTGATWTAKLVAEGSPSLLMTCRASLDDLSCFRSFLVDINGQLPSGFRYQVGSTSLKCGNFALALLLVAVVCWGYFVMNQHQVAGYGIMLMVAVQLVLGGSRTPTTAFYSWAQLPLGIVPSGDA